LTLLARESASVACRLAFANQLALRCRVFILLWRFFGTAIAIADCCVRMVRACAEMSVPVHTLLLLLLLMLQAVAGMLTCSAEVAPSTAASTRKRRAFTIYTARTLG